MIPLSAYPPIDSSLYVHTIIEPHADDVKLDPTPYIMGVDLSHDSDDYIVTTSTDETIPTPRTDEWEAKAEGLHDGFGYRWARVLERELKVRARMKPINLNELAQKVREGNDKWWTDMETGEPIDRNKGELLALIHSEISEALEGERKDLMDDHLPHRKMAEVELADAVIRIFDYSAGFGYDLQGAFNEKMAYNQIRADHKTENRQKAGGKKF